MKHKILLGVALLFGALWLGLELFLRLRPPEGAILVSGLRIGQNLLGLLFDVLLAAFALASRKAPAVVGAVVLLPGVAFHAASITIGTVRPIVALRQSAPAFADALVQFVRAYGKFAPFAAGLALLLILIPAIIKTRKKA
ncbi:MAG: hypothetical protein LBS96_08440 [Oscillospiraceae bacterium]|jgi:hypothetical protein|nr:hypothetical protein [Oscillospiraceae bacterium]